MNPKLDLTLTAKKLGYFLTKNQACIATAESCTGGWLAQSITDIAGSSGWFDRGFITYSNTSKSEMLSVKKQTIQEFGAVSAEVAKQMVQGALHHSQADYALAITGIAGPTGGTLQKPIGTVYIAWQKKSDTATVTREYFHGNRTAIRQQAVFKALSLILESLGIQQS